MMRIRLMAPLAAGFLAAAAISGFPASAADQSVAASGFSWTPNNVSVDAGDSGTWTSDGGFHNVCVQKPGTSGSDCSEFTNGSPSSAWTSTSHTFTTPGTYTFFCEAHRSLGMTGTITVGGSSTGTATTPPTD